MILRNKIDYKMQLTGAEIAIRCLQEEGVDYVFGYPGGAVLYIYDEFFKQDKVKHILVLHEQAAMHAADGYSRAPALRWSPAVRVCHQRGNGHRHGASGFGAAGDRAGQVPTHAIGLDAFQKVDTVGITRHCVKHNFLVKDVKDLAVTMKKAFYIAMTGRPGPVLVDIPKDVSMALCEFEYPKTVSLRSYTPVTKGHAGQIKKAIQMLLETKRPMIYAGSGVILGDAAAALVGFLEHLRFLTQRSENNSRLLGALARRVGLFFRTSQARQFLTNNRPHIRYKVLTFDCAP